MWRETLNQGVDVLTQFDSVKVNIEKIDMCHNRAAVCSPVQQNGFVSIFWKTKFTGLFEICKCNGNKKQGRGVCHVISDENILFQFLSLVLAESPLLLRMLHDLLLHVESFTTPYGIHVLEGLVFRVCFLTKVQIFFLRGGNPVRITTDCLQYRTDEGNSNMSDQTLVSRSSAECVQRAFDDATVLKEAQFSLRQCLNAILSSTIQSNNHRLNKSIWIKASLTKKMRKTKIVRLKI